MDNKCNDIHVPALAGVAAYCVNEYDLAGPWLNAAQASGMLAKVNEGQCNSITPCIPT